MRAIPSVQVPQPLNWHDEPIPTSCSWPSACRASTGSATRQIAESPDLAHVHMLILTTFDHDEYIIEALGAGASGFVIKNTDPGQLLNGIRVVAGGEGLLSPGLTVGWLPALSTVAYTASSILEGWTSSRCASERSLSWPRTA